MTREIAHAGDTAKLPGAFLMGVSGTEGSYTAAPINGDATNGLDVDVTRVCGQTFTFGAGAVAAGTPRVTLGSDDPAVASLGIMDDWDESDRCKVNPIVGQAGVAGGAGAVGATVQRDPGKR